MKNPSADTIMPAGKIKKFQPQLYQMCRVFGYNSKHRKLLFENVVAAAFINLKQDKIRRLDNTLLLRACINLSIFYEIAYEADPREKETHALTGSYEKALTEFRKVIANMSAFEKTHFYLSLLNLPEVVIRDVTGVAGAETIQQHAAIV